MGLTFRLATEREHVIVRVYVDDALDAADPIDWVAADITVAAGAFSGTYAANLTARDFPPFRRELSLLHQRLHGTATFETLEDQLRIEVEGDSKGHMLARCEATDAAGTGNELRFRIEFDQTELAPTLRGLDAICAVIAPLLTSR